MQLVGSYYNGDFKNHIIPANFRLSSVQDDFFKNYITKYLTHDTYQEQVNIHNSNFNLMELITRSAEEFEHTLILLLSTTIVYVIGHFSMSTLLHRNVLYFNLNCVLNMKFSNHSNLIHIY